MDAQPLSGLRVIEAGQSVALACCGLQFAQWGADVLMLEPPAGSALRRAAPTWRLGAAQGSVPFEAFTAGQRSATVPEGPSLAGALEGVDVLLVDGTLDGPLGATPGALRADRPGLVVVSLTPFGLTGPLAGQTAGIARLEALSGYLSLNGPAGRAPIAAPAHLLEHAAGVSAFAGALAALIRRQSTGAGDLVEVSILETVAGLLPFLREQHQGASAPRLGGTLEGARLLRCRDGFVSVAPAIPAHFDAYRQVLEVPNSAAPEPLLAGGRGHAADRVIAALAPYAARHSTQAVCDGLQARGVACGVVQSPQSVLGDPQLAALNFFRRLRHPQLGPLPLAGRAARLSEAAPWSPRAAPDPATSPSSFAAHAAVVRPTAATGAASAVAPGPPLRGLRVLDLTQAWIGPLAGMILGDLGADVVKVEATHRPDIWRALGQAAPAADLALTDPFNRSWYFNAVNRNKRGLGLDLSRPQGAAAFLKLATDADVVLENFTPRVMGRFGLGYEALRQTRRDIVMTSFSGFGPLGPRADAKANGASIEAFAGWDALHRDEAGDPVLMGAYPADPICGLQMAACTLVALYRRNRTGQGGHVEGAMMAAAAAGVGDALLAAGMAGAGATITEAPRPRLSGDDAPGDWRVTDADGESTPVRSTLEALGDPHLAARAWFIALESPGLGVSRHNGAFWRFAEAALPPPIPPPKVGEHTREILAEVLGANQTDALIAAGVAGGLP